MKFYREICRLMALLMVMCVNLAHAQLADLSSTTQFWDRDAAMASSRSVEFDTVVNRLSQPATLADGKNAVLALKQLSLRDDWPLPAREAAIYQFTRHLADFSSSIVDPDILEYLSSYQPQVLVEGEHGGKQVLFNIRAAAAGVENGWLRVDSARQAAAELIAGPENWLEMYSGAQHPAQRSGYLDALTLADPAAVQAVQNAALEQLPNNAELTAVVALTATLSNNLDAARQLLVDGRGSQLAPALVKLSSSASTDQLTSLLTFAVIQAPTVNAALAIASWAPGLSANQNIRQLMLDTLKDPELGAAAAMALANKPDMQTIRELQMLSSGQGLSALRAEMALDINRNTLIQDRQK